MLLWPWDCLAVIGVLWVYIWEETNSQQWLAMPGQLLKVKACFFFLLASFLHFSLPEGQQLDSVACKKVELRMSSLYVLLLYQMAFMEPRSVRKWLWLGSCSGERKERGWGGDWLLSEFYLDNWRIRDCRSWGCTHGRSENPQRLQSMDQSGGWAQSQTRCTQWILAKQGQPQMWKQPEKHWKWWDKERSSGIST